MKNQPRFRKPYCRFGGLRVDARLEPDALQEIWERVRAEGSSEKLLKELADDFGVSSESVRRIAASEFPYVVDSPDDDETREDDE